MKKIISFSLYGSLPKYNFGMIANVKIAKKIFPDWICRVYYDDSVPISTIGELSNHDNVELVNMESFDKSLFPMIWRFLPVDDEDVSITISRDADARLSNREKFCVDIFEQSNMLLHSIRDNPSHPDIMGGMWGMKKNNRIKMKDLVSDWKLFGYDSDQQFLRSKVVPKFVDSYLIHCSYYLNNFPVARDSEYFVGGWWDENNFGKPIDFIFF